MIKQKKTIRMCLFRLFSSAEIRKKTKKTAINFSIYRTLLWYLQTFLIECYLHNSQDLIIQMLTCPYNKDFRSKKQWYSKGLLSLSKFSIKNLVKENFDQENLVKQSHVLSLSKFFWWLVKEKAGIQCLQRVKWLQ